MRQVRTGTSGRFFPCRSTRKIEWMPVVHNLGTPEINKNSVCLIICDENALFLFPKGVPLKKIVFTSKDMTFFFNFMQFFFKKF